MPEYNIEELKKREYDSVKKLLVLSRDLVKKQEYEKSILYLNILINNYATYKEVLDAEKLKNQLLIKILIIKINESENINEVISLVSDIIDPDILDLASQKIREIIEDTDNISVLEDYLENKKFKEHEGIAQSRLKDLKEALREQKYNEAMALNTAEGFKNFIKDYPNDQRLKEIELKIIDLEVQEIFEGEYGEIPSVTLSGKRNEVDSEIDIKNDTRYTLTLRYSGKDIIKINIPPYAIKKIKLKSGEYRVTASVDAADVRNFAGSESLYGEYSISYYITN